MQNASPELAHVGFAFLGVNVLQNLGRSAQDLSSNLVGSAETRPTSAESLWMLQILGRARLKPRHCDEVVRVYLYHRFARCIWTRIYESSLLGYMCRLFPQSSLTDDLHNPVCEQVRGRRACTSNQSMKRRAPVAKTPRLYCVGSMPGCFCCNLSKPPWHT